VKTPPERTVSDFFDNELRDYALYTVENRAIPSLIDGFKPSQRKIAHTANQVWKTGKEKPMKVFQLGGLAASMTMFHHGSLDGTIIGMTQDFKNSMPIFQGVGQFGSLRSPEAGAPRYVGVKFNENFRLLYKDFDLVKEQEEEGEKIEPKFFLPIIPTVLLNGGSGIAVGFATNILNRHPADLVRACLAVLKGKECPEIKPWISGFLGNFLRVPDAPKSWTIHGKFSIKNTSTVEVTEIPPSFTYEKYEVYLENLIQKGTLVSYDDHSAETPHYVLKFRRTELAQLVKRKRLPAILKMQERVGENYTTLDERGSLKIFDSPEEIVKYFVKFRLKYYGHRKKGTIKRLERELRIANNRARFIDEILVGNLIINNRAKKDIEEDLVQMEFSREEGSFNYLLNMAIHSLTKEKANDLRCFTAVKKKELEQAQKTSPDQMYESDLRALLRKIG
jgi:DNA topoisomerase II|tara:strand:+ start:5046 stop:6392 length:1347 start_codon:yes stop_codon:yes gene_type:complete